MFNLNEGWNFIFFCDADNISREDIIMIKAIKLVAPNFPFSSFWRRFGPNLTNVCKRMSDIDDRFAENLARIICKQDDIKDDALIQDLSNILKTELRGTEKDFLKTNYLGSIVLTVEDE